MMKWKKSKRINSMHYRVLVSALSVIFVAAVLILAIYFSVYIKNAENEYTSIVQASLTNIDLSFSQFMKSISTECVTIYNSIEGTKVRVVPDYIPAHAVKITNDIRNSFELFPFMHSVCIIDKNNNIALNIVNNAINSIQVSEDEIKSYLEAQDSASNWILWSAKKKYSEDTIQLLSYCYRTTFPGRKFYQGACVINLDLSAFSKSIFNEIKDENTAFYIINSDGKVIVHSDSDICGTESFENYDDYLNVAQRQNTKVNSRSTNKIQSIKSSIHGYYIIAQGDYHHRNASSPSEMKRTGILVLLIFIISAVALYVLYLRIFKPFNSIVDAAQKQLIRDNNNDNDIEVLRNYYKELSDNIDELKEKEDRNAIVKMLLKDVEVNRMMIEKNLLDIKNVFYVVFMHIGSETEFDRQLLEYEKLRNYFITGCIPDLNQFGASVAYDVGFRKVMFIIETASDALCPKEKLIGAVIQKQQTLSDECDCFITSFISDLKYAETSSILSLYRDSESCIRTRRYLDNKQQSIVIVEDESGKKEVYSSGKLLDYLKSGHRDAFSKALYNWLDENKNSPWDWFYSELFSLAKDIVNIQDINESVLNIEQILEKELDYLRGFENIIDWFLALYDDAFSVIKSANDYSMISLMEKAISYTDEHYDNPDLNLTTLANSLHISAPYLGKNFRKFTGVGFTEYLNKIRMEHAKMLLLDNTGSISTVAKKVGYLNNAYFTTSFKNYYGMTPSKFKAYVNSQREQK